MKIVCHCFRYYGNRREGFEVLWKYNGFEGYMEYTSYISLQKILMQDGRFTIYDI